MGFVRGSFGQLAGKRVAPSDRRDSEWDDGGPLAELNRKLLLFQTQSRLGASGDSGCCREYAGFYRTCRY